MSIPEQAGKVATSTIDALKTNPSCLAAILLAGLFAGLTYYSARARDAEYHETRMALIDRCFPPYSQIKQSIMEAIDDRDDSDWQKYLNSLSERRREEQDRKP